MALEADARALWRDAQIIRHHRIESLQSLGVIPGVLHVPGVVQEQQRVQPQRADLAVTREERIAPAQRHRVLQIDVGIAAQQPDQHQHGDRCTAEAGCLAGNLCLGLVQGDALQTQEGQQRQRHRGQPAQGDPHHWIGLPDHVRGNLRIGGIAERRGIQTHAQISVMSEVEHVDQDQHEQQQGQVRPDRPAGLLRETLAQTRQQQRDAHRQHQQQRKPHVELQTDAQRGPHGLGILTGRHAGESQQEHRTQRRQQQEKNACPTGKIAQAPRHQKIHARPLVLVIAWIPVPSPGHRARHRVPRASPADCRAPAWPVRRCGQACRSVR